uniref:Uncharacterized protein n=1 Tax=Proboscia inermis TaxID=420281 RepID=A0A7S0CLE1_9STRA
MPPLPILNPFTIIMDDSPTADPEAKLYLPPNNTTVHVTRSNFKLCPETTVYNPATGSASTLSSETTLPAPPTPILSRHNGQTTFLVPPSVTLLPPPTLCFAHPRCCNQSCVCIKHLNQPRTRFTELFD